MKKDRLLGRSEVVEDELLRETGLQSKKTFKSLEV